MSTPSSRSSGSALGLASAVSIVAMLPVFLVGALAVQITDDLLFGATVLGGAVAVYRGSSTLASAPLGSLTDRIGATNAVRISTALSAVACFGIAATSRGWLTFYLWLVLAGGSHALGQPAANRLIVNSVPSNRRGVAFGIKQSSAPLASMLAGFSVPLLALTVGWRWAYVLAGVFAVALSIAVRRRPARSTPERRKQTTQEASAAGLPPLPTIVLYGASFGLGTVASSAATTFSVDSAVEHAGLSPGRAGSVFAIASIASIVSRIVAGLSCDRLPAGHLNLAGGLMAIGAVGFVLMSTGEPGLLEVGMALALLGAWGFNGVFWYALVRAYPQSPGSITGAVLPGATLGATLGPLALGAVVAAFDYRTGWVATAVVSILAAGLLAIADRRIRQESEPTGEGAA